MTEVNNNATTQFNSDNDVTPIVIKFISDKLGISVETISPDSALIEDLGADSLDLVELVMEVEEHFQIIIPDLDAAKLLTVRNITDYINKMKPDLNQIKHK